MKRNFFRIAKTSIIILTSILPGLSLANIISAADGTTVYLRENFGVEYQFNDTTGTWTVISSFPTTLINIGGGTSGIDINFSSGSHLVANNSEYFIVGSNDINFTYNTSTIPIYNGGNSIAGYRIGSIVIGNDVVYDSSVNNSASKFIENNGIIDNITNLGTIIADYGILNWADGEIQTITNYGSITSINAESIKTYNTTMPIVTLNNAQGGDNSSPSRTALTFWGSSLPSNYNIIITSGQHYGQMQLINPYGTPTSESTFGIYSGGVAGVPASFITQNRYAAVLSGIDSASYFSGGNVPSGIYNGRNWYLSQVGLSDIWDLYFDGTFGPTAADTQSSLNALASKLRGAFSGQTMATNFANMNTYDCNLFDAKGLCVSVGGQQTYVDIPSANTTSAVVVAGYKVSPTLRVGGFLNQNVNSNTGSNVDISNNSPLMGLFAVWNQNENHLGYQVKIANAYQDTDVRTTRDVIGTSEAGRGKTDLNTQSYVGELSYAFLTNEDKTLVRPYAAVRYTRIKQDGYTEDATISTPLTYAALSDRSTAALVGVKLNHKLTDKVNLKGSLGVEQDLNHDVDNLTASGVNGLTSEAFNNNINRTRPVASIGAYYMPVKNQRIAADIYYQQLPFQSTASTTAYVNYMIGF